MIYFGDYKNPVGSIDAVTYFRWLREGQPLPVLDFNFKDMEGIKTILTPDELANFKPVPSMLKKGEVSFHSSLTVHGSYGNRYII